MAQRRLVSEAQAARAVDGAKATSGRVALSMTGLARAAEGGVSAYASARENHIGSKRGDTGSPGA